MKTAILCIIIVLSVLYNSNIHPGTGNISKSKTDYQSGLEGTWQGTLAISSVELRIVFNIVKDSLGNLSATLDSPDQGAFGINVDEIIVNSDSVKFIVNTIKGFYEGIFIQDSLLITGIWNQGGMKLKLDLHKTEIVEKVNRPQEPKEPFPYKSEEVKFVNDIAGDTLAGTLTLPEGDGPFTAIVLVTGSGRQDRDEKILGHKPFLVLADYLTRNGIAVLRYDDRGVGESTGDFSIATSKDFADDALAAVDYLSSRKEINKIGVGGHSEGGMIAPMVANNTDKVSFIVLIAGTGIRGDSILMLQSELIMRAGGEDEESIKKNLVFSREVYNEILTDKTDEELKSELSRILKNAYKELSNEDQNLAGNEEEFIQNQLSVTMSPWFRYFVKYDPQPTLQKVKCPTLAIIGEKDLQVPPKENLSAIENALKKGGNKNYKIVEMPGLNHLFQNCETGTPSEYAKIEETFSPDAMKVIADWINSVTND